MLSSRDDIRYNMRMLVSVSFLLALIGLIFIYSASSVFALEKFGSSHYFLKRQLMYLILSTGCFYIFASTPLWLIRRCTPFLFLSALVVTALTIFPVFSQKVHGSSRWLYVGGVSLQPSEFLKVFLLMYVALFLEKKHGKFTGFVHSYLPFVIILGAAFLLLLKQPDFGSVVTIFITVLALFFIAGFNMKHLGIALLMALPATVYLICTKAYRLNRVMVFLNPWKDPQGRGFQIIQSLIAIGSGNLWGLGIANSKQKFFYLPMQHTDFIFPIIAEETGFFGALFLLGLYMLFFWYGLRIALRLKSSFAFFTVISFVSFISLQAMLNIMVALGLVPTKGMGLPFVSYGGSSLLAMFCMVGLIVNFVRTEL